MAFDSKGLETYNDVASRMTEFFAKHPEGSLQPADPANPFEIKQVADKLFVVYRAAAYRTPDDPRPGIGIAWEPFPGRTPYTRDSEVMNAETSAWGRAILAVGAADTRKGVASQEEVRNRQADRDADWEQAEPATPNRQRVVANGQRAIAGAADMATLANLKNTVDELALNNTITLDDAQGLHAAILAREAELSGNHVDEASAPAESAPRPAGPPIRDEQRRKMFGLFNDLAMGDRTRQMELMRRVAGRDLGSRNDLTAEEAANIIAALESQKRQSGKANGHHPEPAGAAA